MLSWIGWIATACFGLSYFFKKPATLRLIQAGAAILWISYGLLIHAMPVVVANVIVALAALYSTFAGNLAKRKAQRKTVLTQGKVRPRRRAFSSLHQSTFSISGFGNPTGASLPPISRRGSVVPSC